MKTSEALLDRPSSLPDCSLVGLATVFSGNAVVWACTPWPNKLANNAGRQFSPLGVATAKGHMGRGSGRQDATGLADRPCYRNEKAPHRSAGPVTKGRTIALALQPMAGRRRAQPVAEQTSGAQPTWLEPTRHA